MGEGQVPSLGPEGDFKVLKLSLQLLQQGIWKGSQGGCSRLQHGSSNADFFRGPSAPSLRKKQQRQQKQVSGLWLSSLAVLKSAHEECAKAS